MYQSGEPMHPTYASPHTRAITSVHWRTLTEAGHRLSDCSVNEAHRPTLASFVTYLQSQKLSKAFAAPCGLGRKTICSILVRMYPPLTIL